MIRKLQKVDINRVADIWLKTNLKAHFFIPEQYWISNYEFVKEMLPQAEVYVYSDDAMGAARRDPRRREIPVGRFAAGH